MDERKFDPAQKRDDHGRWSLSSALKHIGDVLGTDVKLHEEFGDEGGKPRGFVALHADGGITVNTHETGDKPAKHHAYLVEGDELESLRASLEDASDGGTGSDEGSGWRLEWDADGVTLHGEEESARPTQTRLSHSEALSLAEAISEVRSRSRDSIDLTDVAPLRDSESLNGKKSFGDSEHPLGLAVVDGPEGRTVRLAPIGWLDLDGGGKELKNYTGGQGMSSAQLDEASAAQLSKDLSELSAYAETRRKAIQKAYDQLDADGDEAAFDVATAPWYTGGFTKLASGAMSPNIDGHFGTPREVETPWGTVVAQGYSDEMGGWHLEVGVRPKGAEQNADWSLDGVVHNPDGSYSSLYEDGQYAGMQHVTLAQGGEIPHGELEAKDVRALIKYLAVAFAAPTAAGQPRARALDVLSTRALAALAGVRTPDGRRQESARHGPPAEQLGGPVDAMNHVPSLGDDAAYEDMLHKLFAGCTDVELDEFGRLADDAYDEAYGSSMPRSRFSKLSAALARKGARDPDALAAYIGKKKYGRRTFAAMAAAGHRSADSAGDATGEERKYNPLQKRGFHGRWGDGTAGALAHAVEGFAGTDLHFDAKQNGGLDLHLGDGGPGKGAKLRRHDVDELEKMLGAAKSWDVGDQHGLTSHQVIKRADGSDALKSNAHAVLSKVGDDSYELRLGDDLWLGDYNELVKETPDHVKLSGADLDRLRTRLDEAQIHTDAHIGQKEASKPVRDELKIADKIPLDAGEKLVGSDGVEFENGFGGHAAMALVRGDDGRASLRFAADSVLPDQWQGRNGKYTVKFDEAQMTELADKLAGLHTAMLAAEKESDRAFGEAEAYAKKIGYDGPSGASGDPELDRLYKRAWELTDGLEIASGTIEGDGAWGRLGYRAVMTDSGPRAELIVIKPDTQFIGETEQDAFDARSEAGEDVATLDAGDLRTLAVAVARLKHAADTAASTEGRSAMTDDLATRGLAAIHGIGGPDGSPWDTEERQFDASSHPRAPVGSTTGGQFAKAPAQQQPAKAGSSSGGAGSAKKTPVMKAGMAGETEGQTSVKPGAGRKPRHVVIPKGSMGYDPASNHGTGYGSKAGSPKVHTLQDALIRLGFTDLKGRKLASDGKLGPLTTSAVRKAQRALGLKADGLVTPELLKKLTELKSAPNHKSTRKPHAPAHKSTAPAHKAGSSAGAKAGSTAHKAATVHKTSTASSSAGAKAKAKARAEADAAAAARQRLALAEKQRLALAVKIGAAPPPKPTPKRPRVGRIDAYDPAGRSADLRRFDPSQLRDPHSGEWTDGIPGSGDIEDEAEALVPELLGAKGGKHPVAAFRDAYGDYGPEGGRVVSVGDGDHKPNWAKEGPDGGEVFTAEEAVHVARGLDSMTLVARTAPTPAQGPDDGPAVLGHVAVGSYHVTAFHDGNGDLWGEGERFIQVRSDSDWQFALDTPPGALYLALDVSAAPKLANAMREMAAESEPVAGTAASRSRPHAFTRRRSIRPQTIPSPQRRSALMSLCTRAFDFEFETRSATGSGGDGRTLDGYAAVFNTSTRIRDLQGEFDERILPGAFARSIGQRMPVLQFDHGKDPAVGGAPIGKITHLAEDSKGLHVRARLFADQSISRVREAIAEQAIKGMSFRFGVPQGGDEWKRRNGDVDLREIRDTDIHELGPVVFPAYDATSVSVRSILSGLSAAEVRELVHELRESFGLAVDLRALGEGAGDDEDRCEDPDCQCAARTNAANAPTSAAGSFGASFPPDANGRANGRATGGIVRPGRNGAPRTKRSTSDPSDITGRSGARRADGGDDGTPPSSGAPVPNPLSLLAPEEMRLMERALTAIGAL